MRRNPTTRVSALKGAAGGILDLEALERCEQDKHRSQRSSSSTAQPVGTAAVAPRRRQRPPTRGGLEWWGRVQGGLCRNSFRIHGQVLTSLHFQSSQLPPTEEGGQRRCVITLNLTRIPKRTSFIRSVPHVQGNESLRASVQEWAERKRQLRAADIQPHDAASDHLPILTKAIKLCERGDVLQRPHHLSPASRAQRIIPAH